VHEGGAKISGSNAENEHILVAIDAGTYNVHKATCGYICNNCNGMVSSAFIVPGFTVPYQGNTQLSTDVTWNTGHVYDRTTLASWSSTNQSVATVSQGLTHGVATGSVTIIGNDFTEPWAGQVCGSPPPVCPPDQGFQSSGSGTTNPTITSITPTFGHGIVPVTIVGSGFGSAGTVSFSGTGITVTYGTRTNTSITATFDTTNAPAGTQQVTVTNGTRSNPVNFQVTPTTPVPVNFRQTGQTDEGGGYIQVTYQWDSSTGHLADLGACQSREYVTYPTSGNGPCNTGQQCYWPPSPPFPPPNQSGTGYVNPTIVAGSATAGGVTDNNLIQNLNFVKPYSNSSFQATQVQQYSCNNGSWIQYGGPFTITRQVVKNVQGQWVFSISKTGVSFSSTYVLP